MMDRQTADTLLQEGELAAVFEATVSGARELERQLLANDIPVLLAKPPPKACCGGGCGCGAKLQLLVREGDVPKVGHLMQQEWLAAVQRDTGASLVQLGLPQEGEGGELSCPACGFKGALVEGACGDCGLQLE